MQIAAKLLLVACFSLVTSFYEPRSVEAATYSGKVVDAETGEPLKGAVIAVIWHKKAILSMNGGWSFHNAKETLTDAEGRFSLDASEGINWNPLTIVQLPAVIIFQPGYGPLSPSTPRGYRDIVEMIEALEKGALIKLPKLSTKDELLRFSNLGPHVLSYVPHQSIPNYVRLVNAQRKNLGIQGYPER